LHSLREMVWSLWGFPPSARGVFNRPPATVMGLNNKMRVVTRRAYGFRTYKAMEIALGHTLGRLPEPEESTHKFC
jgi:hypothetical protein